MRKLWSESSGTPDVFICKILPGLFCLFRRFNFLPGLVCIPIDPSASSRSTCNQKMNNTSGKRSDLYFPWRKISWYLPFVGKLKLQIDCTVTR